MANKPPFIEYKNKDFIAVASRAMDKYCIVPAHASRTLYEDIETNISVRNQFTRYDYEYFRPSESIPTRPKDIIKVCRNAYKRVGVIRNIIDLMGDFGCQGVRLVHPNKSIQKFYRGWFKKVGGKHVSERFLNVFYRDGVAIVKRATGKINIKQRKLIRTTGKLKGDSKFKNDVEVVKGVIPVRYNFLNPLSVDVVDGELSKFVGKTIYCLNVGHSLRSAIKSKDKYSKELVDMIPRDLLSAIESGESKILLDPEKIIVKHYKKDDWQTWADPMIYAVLSELFLLEKMQLADLAALDGAISQIRVWKLGDLEKGVFPTDAAVDKLHDILMSNPGGGAFDLIWGPDLTVEDYSTDVHKFLGESKYRPIMERIYAGLGVPPTLTGSSDSGYTNNYISLKTLIQRLEYGRTVLTEFWENEIEIVRKAMGFRVGAKVEFDNMILSDESAEKALLIQLVDRDIISLETVLEKFGEIPEFEEIRLRNEQKRRNSGKIVDRAGPWHNPEKEFSLKKIALQRGLVSDDDLPFELDDNSGVPGEGRPVGSKDKDKRDARTVKPIGSSVGEFFSLMNWAYYAQDKINSVLQPIILGHYGKSTMRELSSAQVKSVDGLKFSIFCNLSPYSDVNEKIISDIVNNKPKKHKYIVKLVDGMITKYIKEHGVEPSVAAMKMIRACAYSAIFCKGDNDAEN